MSSNGINGHYYIRDPRGELDANAHEEHVKPCCARALGGGHCYLQDGHTGEHTGVPLRYNHPYPEIDLRIKTRPREQKPIPQAPQAEVTWPAIGVEWPRYTDGSRILTVTEVNPTSPEERHIVGRISSPDSLSDQRYACSRMVLDTLWRAIV